MDDVRSKIDQACRVAEEFTKLYYETVDKRRHLISRLYMDTGLLSWNGNGVTGNENILKFMIDLPPTDHEISTLDAQPILDSAVNGQITLMIQVSGNVKYQEKPTKTFQQNFIVTAQGDKWKIVSDCFRLQEPLNTKNS
ncbi:NTF2-related export protein [Diorhabda carinulata]|uniref:NTF2-related export protein n=1 Tax=Diorhabda sublineata TaxID=1163346 RepID=UPI0024E07DAC|nr:NTF2-related export protein [Diorhabda sublineata]XP_057661027.1 NTF2-related export protein [Diorhabda carinulata]